MPLSPNMNLPIPVPSQTGGPQYALDEQSCFQQIDSHNHTPGQGSLIPLNGLNINQNLDMNNFSVTNLKSLQLNNQAISPGSSSLYMLGNDLYFSDGTGAFNVQITSGNSVAVSGAVGFSGLPSGTASAAYISVLGDFRFQSATNTAANLDVGPIKLRNTTASSNAITLSAPAPLPADYSLTLPSALPASTKIMQLASTGIISATLDADNSTIEISGNNIQVKSGGITQTQLANNSVGTNQIIDGSVTQAKLSVASSFYSASSASGSATFNSSNPQTVLSVTVNNTAANTYYSVVNDSTSGGPVIIVGGAFEKFGGAWGNGGGSFGSGFPSFDTLVNGPGLSNVVLYSGAAFLFTTTQRIVPMKGSTIVLLPQVGTYTIFTRLATIYGGGGETVNWYNIFLRVKGLL